MQTHATAFYLIGDASGAGFVSAFWDYKSLHYQADIHAEDPAHKTSNFTETDNLVSHLEELVEGGLLNDVEIFLITDNLSSMVPSMKDTPLLGSSMAYPLPSSPSKGVFLHPSCGPNAMNTHPVLSSLLYRFAIFHQDYLCEGLEEVRLIHMPDQGRVVCLVQEWSMPEDGQNSEINEALSVQMILALLNKVRQDWTQAHSPSIQGGGKEFACAVFISFGVTL